MLVYSNRVCRMREVAEGRNIDTATVAGFGEEWDSFDQTHLEDAEWLELFNRYFAIFPFDTLPHGAEGFDLGCGSGRWAAGIAPRVGVLNCIDPSSKALAVARRRLAGEAGARFHNASVDAIPLANGSQDFGYSLGVLHHIPDTAAAMRDCVAKLKPGAPFLVYLYYAFDNRPAWFRAIWKASDLLRQVICRLPFGLRKAVTTAVAALVYWPLARVSLLAEKAGLNVERMPLSPYRANSFYTMRTDALDRLGTRLEQRFTRTEIAAMMSQAGLEHIRFSEGVPYWVAVGTRRR
jgi:SAM-dependent methyltransferase